MCGTFDDLLPDSAHSRSLKAVADPSPIPTPTPTPSASPSSPLCLPAWNVPTNQRIFARGQGNTFNDWGVDDSVGNSVASIGDVDGQGTDDILVRVKLEYLWLVLTQRGGDVLSMREVGGSYGEDFGFSSGQGFGTAMAGLGDLSGAGNVTFVAVSAPGFDPPGITSGRGAIAIIGLDLSGNVHGTAVHIAHGSNRFEGLGRGWPDSNTQFGRSLSALPAGPDGAA